MIDATVLGPVVDAFVTEVTEALISAAAPGARADHLRTDVINEAFNLSVAFIDVDDRHTDNECWALTATFGSLLPETKLAGATPTVLRGSQLIAGKASWLNTPSTLFEILLAADRRDHSDSAMAYYRRAMDICHVIASLDEVTAQAELIALGKFRSMLLDLIRLNTHSIPVPSIVPESATDAPEEPIPAPAPRPLEELLAELDALIGLAEVKAEVRLVTDLLRVQQLRRQRDLPTMATALHLVFVGNPGTGKTTVARLLAQIYLSVGALAKGHLVEVDRSTMVAGYVGQTAPLVAKQFAAAKGGMLFIDEAYTLVRGGENDFGREAIDAIVKLIEDHRDTTVVVVAGYPAEMEAFIGANPGLRSRFPKTISFPDYSTPELASIFEGLCRKQRYQLTPAAEKRLNEIIDSVPRTKGFGNGRYVRNLFEATIARQSTRVIQLTEPTDEQLMTFEEADLPDAASTPSEVPSTP